jgi:hypothetical protein
MRISVVGPHRDAVISKIEDALKIEVKRPWEVNGESNILDYAAETYKYFGEHNVVFDGSPFDFLAKDNGEGYDEVNEQIALDTLANVDYINVITLDMDRKTYGVYKDYAAIYPDKFHFYTSYNDFELTMR